MPRAKPSNSEQHMTVAQLADRLQVSTDWLYSDVLGQEGGIIPIRLGDGKRPRLRIPLEEVQRWEQSRRVCYSPVNLNRR